MRDATLRANRAANVVHALIAAKPAGSIPKEMTDPLRPVFVDYYASVAAAFRGLDVADYRLEQERRTRLERYGPAACPGGCHQPTGSPTMPTRWPDLSAWASAGALPGRPGFRPLRGKGPPPPQPHPHRSAIGSGGSR